MLWSRRSLVSALLVLVFSIIITSFGTTSSFSAIAQTSSTATVYFDPPIINGTEVGVDQNFTVNLNIVDAVGIYSWQAGLIFNATVVECLNFTEGEFLSQNGAKQTYPPAPLIINNTLGVIDAYGWTIIGNYPTTSGSGRLAYLTFRVKALGVSDLHLRDVKSIDWVDSEKINIPLKIIDVYTVVVDTTPHSVVTVSNSTGVETIFVGTELVTVHSGFYDHAFNASLEEVGFKVTGPYPGWSNVTIPKTLLNASTLAEWKVIIDNSPLSSGEITPSQNDTHSFIYFTYDSGIHEVQITTRALESSNITINLSSTSIDLGSNVTISGNITADDPVDPVRANATVTILYKPSGGAWTTLGTNQTDSNSSYSFSWKPNAAGTYDLKATWTGDPNTQGDESEVKTLEVKGAAAGIDPYIIAAVAVAIIIIIAIVVYYFVKIRKPEEEE